MHGLAGIQFTSVNDFTTMQAEYAFVDNDIVLHFFLPDEIVIERVRRFVNSGHKPEDVSEYPFWEATLSWVREGRRDDATVTAWATSLIQRDREIQAYWMKTFPTALEKVAVEVFVARPPRLAAAYTEELGSWYFRALGFCVLKPEELVRRLLLRLDQDLDAAGAATLLTTNPT